MTGKHVRVYRVALFISIVAVFVSLGGVCPAYGYVTNEARLTMRCGNHAVEVSNVTFTYNDIPVTDPAPGISCGPGDGATKMYEFDAPKDINGFKCDYVCDGGEVTSIVIPSSRFYFHYPIVFICPSPGGTIEPSPGIPSSEEDAVMAVTHTVLTWPGSECFEFRGPYDYVCVLWRCGGTYEPIFHIYPGCASPCGNPNCTPAQFDSVGYAAPCNPVDDIWCRIFWPVNLTQAGCWCYFFEYQLPVELKSFDAEPLVGAIRLFWTTGSEEDNDYFDLERSTAGGAWAPITRINGQGNSPITTNYSYLDAGLRGGTEYRYRLKAIDFFGNIEELSQVSATPLSTAAPSGYYLSQNYPNPFNATTELVYRLAESGYVRLAVYNLTGRLITTLVNAEQGAGEYQVTFDGGNLASGIYLCRLEAGNFVSQRKMVLLK
jgi:hypothetical protein